MLIIIFLFLKLFFIYMGIFPRLRPPHCATRSSAVHLPHYSLIIITTTATYGGRFLYSNIIIIIIIILNIDSSPNKYDPFTL